MIENARIESTFLGREDHGVFTFMIHLQGPSWCQSFGGTFLEYKSPERVPTAAALALIDIVEALGAGSWEGLAGRLCRVESGEPYGPITAIGNVLDDRWVRMEDYGRE